MVAQNERPIRKRLGACLVSAALMATMVPTRALSEEVVSLGAEETIEAKSQDASAGTEAPADVAAEPEAAREADGDDAQVVQDERQDGGAAAGQSHTNAPIEDSTTGFGISKFDDGASMYRDLEYLERIWDGEKVVEGPAVCDARTMPEDGKLAGGYYFLNSDRTYKERMTVTGDTHLILNEGRTLRADGGIYVEQGATLTIHDRANGGGTIIANADTGAGIGAYSGHKGGDVVVCGGTVEAHGGDHCAGIGSNDGDETKVGSVTVYGGTVKAFGGDDGAGIGGGRESEGGHITIYGGNVTGEGGTDAAGIGGGERGDGGTIVIAGGTVEVVPGNDGAGIGGGDHADGGDIAISGGHVSAKASNGAGIGGGQHCGDGGKITITGGDVSASSEYGAGIGGGKGWVDSSLLKMTNYIHDSGDGGTITISGGTVNATSSRYFGIGAGGFSNLAGSARNRSRGFTTDSVMIGSAGNVSVSGGASVTAQGGVAGIGGDGGTVSIEGGTVTASGLEDGEGAGIFFCGETQKVNVSGGVLTATGRGEFPGIGLENGGEVNITGGEVHAIGDKRPGIGSFEDDTPKGTLNISGHDTRVFAEAAGSNAIGGHENKGLDVHVSDGAMMVADGHAKHGALHVKSLDLYPEAKALTGADEAHAKAQPRDGRAKACREDSSRYVRIEQCDHSDAAYEDVDDHQHKKTCNCCEATLLEDHHFGAGETCADCDVEKPMPVFDERNALTDGRLGVELIVKLPDNLDPSEFEDSVMEFKVGSKGDTIEVPASEARKIGKRYYGFTCPVSCAQMADPITATYRFGRSRDVVCTTSMKDCMDAYRDSRILKTTPGYYPQHRIAEAFDAAVDYGHYSQVLLSREKGWKLGQDYVEMPARTKLSEKDCKETLAAIEEGCGTISCDCAEGVGTLVSLVQGSELATRVTVRTDKELGSVTVDGRELPEGSWRRSSDGWVISLPAVSAKDAAQGHKVVATGADGEAIATLENVSPLTYAGSVLGSKKFAQDKDMRSAMVSLYRFCEAAAKC